MRVDLKSGVHSGRPVLYIPQAGIAKILDEKRIPEIYPAGRRGPRIFIPMAQDLIDGAPSFCARPAYISKLAERGLAPQLIPPTMTRQMVDAAYGRASGVLLMGGSDVDPRYYGATPHKETKSTEPLRDKLEIYIGACIFHDLKPALAVCRGTQVSIVSMSGSLNQHVADLTDEQHMDAYHDVFLSEGSRIRGLVGKEIAQMNSYHHQCAKNVPRELAVTGRTAAGIAEIVEAVDPEHFFIGVQGHPEKEQTSDLEPVFDAFAEACKAYASRF
jgi:putative glutamine amidotransferase